MELHDAGIHTDRVRGELGKITALDLPPGAAEVAQLTLALATAEFGLSLRSVVGMGSLGYPGFVPGWSDFDIDLVIKNDSEHDASELHAIAKRRIEFELHAAGYVRADVRAYTIEQLNAREVPFSSGIASRQIMLLDSARVLWGDDVRNEVQRPARAQIVAESRATNAWLTELVERERGTLPLDDIAAHFALCGRILYTARTGQVAGKRLALCEMLERYSADLPADLVPWIGWALAVRGEEVLRIEREDFKHAAASALCRLSRWTKTKLEE